MKDNKKERKVDSLDIKAFVKKVFQESSWLMAKLAASPEDEGECFVDMAKSISIKRLNELYGDLVDDRIVERLNKEIGEFNRMGQIENILKLSDMLHKKMNKGTLIIPRLTVGNSLLLFLFTSFPCISRSMTTRFVSLTARRFTNIRIPMWR